MNVRKRTARITKIGEIFDNAGGDFFDRGKIDQLKKIKKKAKAEGKELKDLKEEKLESKITKETIDCLNLYPFISAIKVPGTVFSGGGNPDIDIVFNGLSIKVEMKRPGLLPTDLQYERIAEINAANGFAFYASSKQEVLDTLCAKGYFDFLKSIPDSVWVQNIVMKQAKKVFLESKDQSVLIEKQRKLLNIF